MEAQNTIEADETEKTFDVRLRVVSTKDKPAPIHYHTVCGHAFTRQTLAPSDEVDEATGQAYRVPLKGTFVRLSESIIAQMRATIARRWLENIGSSWQVATIGKNRKPRTGMKPLREFLRIELASEEPDKGVDLLDASKPAAQKTPPVPPK